MGVRVAFGNGWHALQWHLPGTDLQALPGTGFSNHLDAWVPGSRRWEFWLSSPDDPRLAPATDALSTALADAGAMDSALFGGSVAHRVEDTGREVFDVAGPWNTVKNVAAVIAASGAYTFDGFVHPDVDASEAGGGVDLLLRGAKRGNVLTAGGDDRVVVGTVIRGGDGEKDFRISTAAGDDEVRLAPLARLDAALPGGDPTYAALLDGPADWSGAARYASAFADLGEGDDVFHAPLMAGAVRGGEGDDTITGNTERPYYTIRNEWFDSVDGGEGDDRIAGSGVLDGGEGDDALTGYGTSSWFYFNGSKTPGSGFSTLRGGEGDDTLAGVAALMDGGEGRDEASIPGRPEDYVITRWTTTAGAATFMDRDYLGLESLTWAEDYTNSFFVVDVEVVRFEGGGPELVLG